MSSSFYLEDGGSNVSAGERQLIGLIRVIARNPRLLIFDEATANIDEKLEQEVGEITKLLTKNRTVITIAHRLKTIVESDVIFVFKEGSLIENKVIFQPFPKREVIFKALLKQVSYKIRTFIKIQKLFLKKQNQFSNSS